MVCNCNGSFCNFDSGCFNIAVSFSHQSVDAANVKVKSMKNTIKNKIQALTRVAVTGNDGISSDGNSGTGTNGNPGSSTNGVPGTEGSRGIVIALPGVDGISDSTGAGGAEQLEVLTGPPELDVLAPAAVEVLVEPVELEEAILAQPVVLLAALLVNLIPAELLHV